MANCTVRKTFRVVNCVTIILNKKYGHMSDDLMERHIKSYKHQIICEPDRQLTNILEGKHM